MGGHHLRFFPVSLLKCFGVLRIDWWSTSSCLFPASISSHYRVDRRTCCSISRSPPARTFDSSSVVLQLPHDLRNNVGNRCSCCASSQSSGSFFSFSSYPSPAILSLCSSRMSGHFSTNILLALGGQSLHKIHCCTVAQ